MQKQCTVDLWTAGYAGSRLTASARSPMDKPWTTLCVAHRLPTGRRLPTSSTVLKPIVIKSGKVKTKTPAPALAYSSPVAVQTTGTTATFAPIRVNWGHIWGHFMKAPDDMNSEIKPSSQHFLFNV